MDFGPARFILMEYLLFCLYIDSNSVLITGVVVVLDIVVVAGADVVIVGVPVVVVVLAVAVLRNVNELKIRIKENSARFNFSLQLSFELECFVGLIVFCFYISRHSPVFI